LIVSPIAMGKLVADCETEEHAADGVGILGFKPMLDIEGGASKRRRRPAGFGLSGCGIA
jgi:hypothetical protein